MHLYFAYGSNLLTERLTARCPSARPLGMAALPGHRVAFAKRSFIDGSGKASVLPAAQAHAPGVLYSISSVDLEVLDSIEGVGKGYKRITCDVKAERDTPTAVTYIATDPEEPLSPFDWYLALIIAGTRQHGLVETALAELMRNRFHADPDPERPVRRAAVAALTAAGHAEWETLLPVTTTSND